MHRSVFKTIPIAVNHSIDRVVENHSVGILLFIDARELKAPKPLNDSLFAVPEWALGPGLTIQFEIPGAEIVDTLGGLLFCNGPCSASELELSIEALNHCHSLGIAAGKAHGVESLNEALNFLLSPPLALNEFLVFRFGFVCHTHLKELPSTGLRLGLQSGLGIQHSSSTPEYFSHVVDVEADNLPTGEHHSEPLTVRRKS